MRGGFVFLTRRAKLFKSGVLRADTFHAPVDRQSPSDGKEARRYLGDYVTHYNTERLHSAIGYVTPQAMLVARLKFIRRATRSWKRLERRKQARSQKAA